MGKSVGGVNPFAFESPVICQVSAPPSWGHTPSGLAQVWLSFRLEVGRTDQRLRGRLYQAVEKLLQEQQAGYAARKPAGTLGEDAVAWTQKWAADARYVVFKDAHFCVRASHPHRVFLLVS